MKTCPKCGQTYSDPNINFCLNDGELLSYMSQDAPRPSSSGRPSAFVDDAPPTEFFNSPRVTNETNWPQAAPPAPYSAPQQQFAQFPMQIAQNQTLAVISLIMGVSSVLVGWCCSLGLLLSPAAIITGIIALMQIKKDPQRNGGRGMAIGGIVAGSVFLAGYVLFIIIYGLAIIGSNL